MLPRSANQPRFTYPPLLPSHEVVRDWPKGANARKLQSHTSRTPRHSSSDSPDAKVKTLRRIGPDCTCYLPRTVQRNRWFPRK